jgi:hypothetical protein
MKFLCSAIKVIPQNTTGFIIISGKRHYNCIETISKLGIKRDKNNDTQGFIVLIDGFETFVDRYDGAQIAKELGYKLEYENCLYSEDIWPE